MVVCNLRRTKYLVMVRLDVVMLEDQRSILGLHNIPLLHQGQM